MNRKMKLKQKILKNGDVVKFTPFTKEYGRAEFIFCPVFKKGALREFHICPAQQPDADCRYSLRLGKGYAPPTFSVAAWTHEGFENPKIWLHFWCKEHKCLSFRMYIVNGTDCFRIEYFSNHIDVKFEKREREQRK